MMKFTNADDLSSTASRLNLAGWYAQDSDGDYLGVVRQVEDDWMVGFLYLKDVPFPVSLDRIPK